MIQDYFILALKNLRHRGLRSWLTLLGIVIGVMVVISLLSLGNGLKLAVMNQFGMSGSEMISVQAGGLNYGPPGTGVIKPLTEKDLEEIERLPRVKRTIRRNIESGRINFGRKNAIGVVTNVPLKDRRFMYDFLELEMKEGRFFEGGDTKKVVLGYNFLVGKSPLIDEQISSGERIIIEGERFEVIGILRRKGSFINDNVIFMVEEDMQRLFDYGDKIDVIGVQPDSKEIIDETKSDIERVLRRTRNVKVGEEDFEVSTPEATLSMISGIIGGIQTFIIIIASISILVGVVGIVNTMTTAVLERRKQIGLMKAIGAKNSQVFFQFFIESGMLGLVGGIIGIFIGTLFGFGGIIALENFLATDIAFKIDWILLATVFIGSFLVGGIAGISPALQAANQNPVEALR